MSIAAAGLLALITLAELLPTSRTPPPDQKAVGARLMMAIQNDSGGRECTSIESFRQTTAIGTEGVVYFVRCHSPSSRNGYRHFLVVRDFDWQNVTATPLNIE
jgi:hypothetical protein